MQSEQVGHSYPANHGVFLPLNTVHDIRNALQVIMDASETNRENGKRVRAEVNRINLLLSTVIRQ